jgi:predicted phosphate transport protein (TIGR00153 family)
MFKTSTKSLFSQSKTLERQIDEFVDIVSQVGLIFKNAIKNYLETGASGEFEKMVEQVSMMESKADKLTKDVETALYEEHLDEMLGLYQGNLYRFSIQKPKFPEEFHTELSNLVNVVVESAETLCTTVRSFFRDIKTVRNSTHKVSFFEKEADKKGSELQRKIFSSDLSLDRKMHLRYFVEKIDLIADFAEDIADEIQIYTLKRMI